MRFFECTELALLLLYVLGFCVPARVRPGMWGILPFLAVAAALVSTLVEGYRPQMFVGHALCGLFCLFSLYQRARANRPEKTWRWYHWIPRLITPVVALALCGISIILPYMFFVFDVPEPTGSYGVGSTHFSVKDTDRLEHWTVDPTDHRELMVKMWYPADLEPDSVRMGYDPYAEEGSKVITSLLNRRIKLPQNWFSYLGLTKSNSYLEPPVAAAEETYPVIIFSHGYLVGSVTQNTLLMEELASHGYIVFSVGHTYESLFIPHPDGRVLPMDRERSMQLEAEVQDTNNMLYILSKGHSEASMGDMFRDAILIVPTLDDSIATWDEDVHFINDVIEKMHHGDLPSIFEGRLDLDRRGVSGMSFGGTVTVRTALTDPRFKAALNLDGPLLAKEIFDCKHEIPFMHIIDSTKANNFNIPVDGAQGPVYKVMVHDSKHLNFADASIFLPRAMNMRLGLGTIDPYHCLKIVNDYSLAFFDQYLKSKPSPLLQQQESPYELVQVETRNIENSSEFTVASD